MSSPVTFGNAAMPASWPLPNRAGGTKMTSRARCAMASTGGGRHCTLTLDQRTVCPSGWGCENMLPWRSAEHALPRMHGYPPSPTMQDLSPRASEFPTPRLGTRCRPDAHLGFKPENVGRRRTRLRCARLGAFQRPSARFRGRTHLCSKCIRGRAAALVRPRR